MENHLLDFQLIYEAACVAYLVSRYLVSVYLVFSRNGWCDMTDSNKYHLMMYCVMKRYIGNNSLFDYEWIFFLSYKYRRTVLLTKIIIMASKNQLLLEHKGDDAFLSLFHFVEVNFKFINQEAYFIIII